MAGHWHPGRAVPHLAMYGEAFETSSAAKASISEMFLHLTHLLFSMYVVQKYNDR